MGIGKETWTRSGLSLLTAALLASAIVSLPRSANAAGAFWGRDQVAVMVTATCSASAWKTPRAAEQTAEKHLPETAGRRDLRWHQHLKVFDVNGLYAESPISTGMPGHSTPMGVFSVIEKQRWHRSNIYSGAPMPYMQRITWSGIAMHEGVLPGYPASRLHPHASAFAIKLFAWTKRGARVIVVPGEISIEQFSHPEIDRSYARRSEDCQHCAGKTSVPASNAARQGRRHQARIEACDAGRCQR